ncbi:MAG: hypothetical protein M3463_12720 [Verrucomicrobiota bacterium]|nr:hypothetical protein [Verrucomicrobiota bacterium]
MHSRTLLVFSFLVLALCLSLFWYLGSEPAAPKAVNAPKAARSAERPAPRYAEASEQNSPILIDWQRKIDGVLRADSDEKAAAQTLIAMLPTLPPEGQAAAAQRIVDLTPDEEYARVAPLVKNTALSARALEVFTEDVTNREDKFKLPTLLDVAKLPDHPRREEAAANLKTLVGQDHGQDWAKWDGAIQTHLQKKAAEEAAAATDSPPAQP